MATPPKKIRATPLRPKPNFMYDYGCIKIKSTIYLQKFSGGPDWRITLKYTLPNIVFSVIFNLPKFFEFDVQEIVETNSETNMTYAKINLNPTNLRLDDNYVYYYVNWSRFLVSGLIPLVSLTVLNFAIYR